MSLLAGIHRILLSSGLSLTARRVMRAMASTLGPLNPLIGASSPSRLIVLRGAMESALARQGRTVHA